MDDARILEEVRKGNDAAYKELVVRYEPQVAATVIGMLGKSPEAEDVGQEVFIRFYNAIDKFRGESSVGTYLTRIAINLSLNELKRRKRRNQFFLYKEDNNVDFADEHSSFDDDGSREIIHNAILKLAPKFRSVITLRLIDGYSTEDTAKILKVPLGTVLSRLARGQQKLKSILSPIMEVNNV